MLCRSYLSDDQVRLFFRVGCILCSAQIRSATYLRLSNYQLFWLLILLARRCVPSRGVCKQVMSENGIDLIRTWGFLNGQDDPYTAGVSIQPSVIPLSHHSFKIIPSAAHFLKNAFPCHVAMMILLTHVVAVFYCHAVR